MDHHIKDQARHIKRKNISLMIRRIICLSTLLFIQLIVMAQDKPKIEMADTMRSNGKIYVVVAVVLTILAMLIIYLFRIDRKISKLEKNINS